MKSIIFGFGYELIGVTIYFLMWGWIVTTLEEKFDRLKGRVFVTAGIAVALLHVFVVSYLVLGFWLVMSIVGMEIWGEKTKKWLDQKTPWMKNFNKHMLRLAVFVMLFIIIRSLWFYAYPEKIWYTNLLR